MAKLFKTKQLRSGASTSSTSSSDTNTGNTSNQESKALDVSLQSSGAPNSLTSTLLRRKAPRAEQWAAAGAYYSSPAIYRVVSPIAHAMASLEVWSETQDNEELGDQPFDALMANPNEYQSSYQYRHLQAIYQIIEGESLGWVIPDPSREAGYQILPLPPHECTLVQGESQQGDNEAEWEVILNGRITRIPFEDVVWTKTADPADPYDRGAGIGRLIADEVQIDEYAAEHIKSTLYNRAVPDQVVHMSGASKSRLKAFAKEWKQAFGGPTKRGLPYFTGTEAEGEELVVKQISEKFSDLGLVDMRKFAMSTVRKALNVQPEIIGETESSNLAKARTAETHFGKFVVKPRMTMMASEWEVHLMPMLGTPNQKVGFESPVPEDRQHKLDVATVFASGIPPHMTINEAREMQGLPPRVDGDVYMRDPFQALVPADETVKEHESSYVIDLEYLDKGLVYDDILHNKAISEAELRVLAEELDFKVGSEELTELMSAKALDFATQQMIMLGQDSKEDVLEAIRPGILDFFKEHTAEAIESMRSTTKQIVKDEVKRGFEEGLGSEAIARNLDKKLKDTNRMRARRIARTEGVQAASVGKDQAIQNSDVVGWKRWLAVGDSDTRDDHDRLNGQTVPKDETFHVGSWRPRYPGDGPVENVVNCRCALQGVVDPDKGLSDKEVEKAIEMHEKGLNKAEKEIMEFIEEGLEATRKDLMHKLGT